MLVVHGEFTWHMSRCRCGLWWTQTRKEQIPPIIEPIADIDVSERVQSDVTLPSTTPSKRRKRTPNTHKRTSHITHRTSQIVHRTSYIIHRTSHIAHRTSHIAHRTTHAHAHAHAHAHTHTHARAHARTVTSMQHVKRYLQRTQVR
jgi:hypothetical protein